MTVPEEQALNELKQTAQARRREQGEAYTDSEFSADAASLDGRRLAAGVAPALAPPACRCRRPAKVCTVMKDGGNQGREFWGCARPADQRCGFFMWADGVRLAGHSKGDAETKWKRFGTHDDGYVVVRRKKDGSRSDPPPTPLCIFDPHLFPHNTTSHKPLCRFTRAALASTRVTSVKAQSVIVGFLPPWPLWRSGGNPCWEETS